MIATRVSGRKTAGLCRVLLSVLVYFAAPDRVPAAADSEISQLIAQLADKRWAERSKAFYRLLKLGAGSAESKGPKKVKPALTSLMSKNPQKAPEIKDALANTLKAENGVVRGGGSMGEEFSDYYGDLIQAVAALEDPNAVGALVGALGTGNMVNNALVSFGDVAVNPVIQQAQTAGDKTIRQSACLVLQKMMDPANRNPIKDAENKRKVQQVLQDGPCSAKKRD